MKLFYAKEIKALFDMYLKKESCTTKKSVAELVYNMLLTDLNIMEIYTNDNACIKKHLMFFRDFHTEWQFNYAQIVNILKPSYNQLKKTRKIITLVSTRIYTNMSDKVKHPLYKTYTYKSGNARSGSNNKLLSNSNKKNGYVENNINVAGPYSLKTVRRHRLILESFLGRIIDSEFDVDHMDQLTLNNSIFNLQLLTKYEHKFKTGEFNNNVKNKTKDTQGKPVRRFKLDELDDRIDIKEYESAVMAAKDSNTFSSNIGACIKKPSYTAGGYFWELVEDQNKTNEKWKSLGGISNIPKTSKYKISDKGRVETFNGRITIGSKQKSGYLKITLDKKSYYVHQLVMLAFVGQPPTKSHTVDHKDRKKSNNDLINLRWATPAEQAHNSLAKPIDVYLYGKFYKKYESMKETCASINVHRCTVKEHLTKGTQMVTGYSFKLATKIKPK